MRTFWFIRNMRYDDGLLLVQASELLSGKPDGGVGLPLVVSRKSRVFELTFFGVGGFLAVPEPESDISVDAEQLEPCVWVERQSRYSREYAEISAWCAFGRRSGTEGALVHYVVPGENFFLHVLAGQPPRVELASTHKTLRQRSVAVGIAGKS